MLALAAVLAPRAMAEERPNLIFLLTDDQTTYSLGCYGNPDVQTPNMDALAAEGIAFDRHYNTTAICQASRANILSGRLEYHNGSNFGHGGMSQVSWDNSYPVLLKEAGYYIAFAGKFGAEAPEGFEEAFDLDGTGPGQTSYDTAKSNKPAINKHADEFPHSSLAYGAFGQDAIKAAKAAGKPLCLSISFKAPHKPATPDPRFDDIYAGKVFTKPANYGRENGKHFSEQSRQGR
ncbi:MAG: sulfatase-like hydrolase/transferase, partial [Planctomycetota bacterium]